MDRIESIQHARDEQHTTVTHDAYPKHTETDSHALTKL